MIVLAGLVLAGGRSRRFGSEKALALSGGRPLLDLAVARLALHCAEVAVNASPGSGAAARAAILGRPLVSDAAGDPDGPLAGIRAGLAWAVGQGAEALAVVPCDAPLLPAGLVPALAAALADAPCAVAEPPDGVQPLCAIWRVELLAGLAAVLADGHPPVGGYLANLGARRVPFSDARAFLNVNTPADLASVDETSRPPGPY
jgi:molybdopterin-guanine dinucleotide biosynthesis protein A